MTKPTSKFWGISSSASPLRVYKSQHNGTPNTQTLHAACVPAILSFPEVLQCSHPALPCPNPQRPIASKLCHRRERPKAQTRPEPFQNMALCCHHARGIWSVHAHGEEPKWYVCTIRCHSPLPRLEQFESRFKGQDSKRCRPTPN